MIVPFYTYQPYMWNMSNTICVEDIKFVIDNLEDNFRISIEKHGYAGVIHYTILGGFQDHAYSSWDTVILQGIPITLDDNEIY